MVDKAAASVNFQGGSIVDGDFTITTSTTGVLSGTVELAGDDQVLDVQSTTYSASSTLTFRFTGAGDQTAQNSGVGPLLVPNIAIAKSGGTLEFLDDLSVQAAQLHRTPVAPPIFPTSQSSSRAGPGGTVTANGLAFGNVVVNKTGAQQLVASSLDVDGDFTLLSGTFFAPNPANSLFVAGDFTRTGGTFTHRNGTVVFDGTSDANLSAMDVTFNNVTVNKSGATLFALTNVDINGAFSLTGGDFQRWIGDHLRRW